MKTASQILEAKGYEGDEVDSIINWGNGNKESLDIQTRVIYKLDAEPVHLLESYYLGDADEEKINKIAKEKGFEDYHELLNEATKHLNSLAEKYRAKN